MNNAEKLSVVQRHVKECSRCPELVENRTQTVFGVGNPNARIVLCGEAPGRDEDKCGEPFVGRAGKLLDSILAELGLKRQDIYILNICKCRPPANRAPTPEEAKNCRPYLNLQLKAIKPNFIICVGAVAAQNLLGVDTPITQMRGMNHGWYEYEGIKVLCTYHPAYLLRNPEAKKDCWADLQLLLKELK